MSNSSNAVCLNGVSFEYSNGDILFKKISLSFHKGRTAVVGNNGIGKSTLARLIAGELQPTSGTIQGTQDVCYLQQTEERPIPGLVGNYLENIWDSFTEDFPRFYKLIDGINPEASLTTLSGGEWMRLRLIKALSRKPSFLILDEPTNNLDKEARSWVYDFIQNYDRTLLVISHDRALLNLVDQIVEISSQGIRTFGGDFESFQESKIQEESLLEYRIEIAKKEKNKRHFQAVERVQKQQKKNRKAHQESLKGGMPRILRGGLKRKAQKTLGNVQIQTQNMYRESAEKLKNLTDQNLQDFNIRYTNQNHWLWASPLTWNFKGPRRFALEGKNGSGKSTLAKALIGKNPVTLCKGTLELGRVQSQYLDQDYSILNDNLSIFENIQEVSRLAESDIRNKLARFQFVSESPHKKIKSLSGGEKLKAALAKILLNSNPLEFLVLDEPTNNLDLQSLQVLVESIKNFNGALLVISHDETFLNELDLDGRIELVGPGIAID